MRGVIKEGGTAFPCHGINGQVFQYGMTLRDWFAGQALAGHCFKLANAMIAEREGRAK